MSNHYDSSDIHSDAALYACAELEQCSAQGVHTAHEFVLLSATETVTKQCAGIVPDLKAHRFNCAHCGMLCQIAGFGELYGNRPSLPAAAFTYAENAPICDYCVSAEQIADIKAGKPVYAYLTGTMPKAALTSWGGSVIARVTWISSPMRRNHNVRAWNAVLDDGTEVYGRCGQNNELTLVRLVKPTTYVIQGDYGHGWEDTDAATNLKDARASIKAYRVNAPEYSYRIITRKGDK